jgi:metal-sulfur cluster biosynthetic enzyme
MATVNEDEVNDALRDVIDPEVGINIVDLGLVESVEPDDQGGVRVGLIMTTPACPQGDMIVAEARHALLGALGTDRRITVELLDEPLWSPERLSQSARQMMGWG